ncbi:MAG: PAS domain-containing sensor histidine kinase, partial [Rubrivivax sp.]
MTAGVADADAGADDGPRLDALYDGAPCGLMLTTPDGTILRVNDTLCSWLGRDRASLVDGCRLQDLLSIGSQIFHQTHWAPLLQIQGSVSEVKLEVLGPGGTRFPAVVNAVQRVHGGRVLHEVALFVAEDRHRYEHELLIARRRAEELLHAEQQTRQALTAAQEELDRQRATAEDRALFAEQMMGIVSHDLRNPLSVIRMSAHIMGMSDLSSNQLMALQRLTNASTRAQRLIADLLDFTQARIGSGLPMVLKPIDLHELVADSLEDLRLAYPLRVILHRQLGSGFCPASSDRLVQAIGNLVSNAAHHGSADGPITVTSEIGPVSCTITVHNEGDPLPDALLPTVFEP